MERKRKLEKCTEVPISDSNGVKNESFKPTEGVDSTTSAAPSIHDTGVAARDIATKIYAAGEASATAIANGGSAAAGETVAWLQSIGAKEAINNIAAGVANTASSVPSIQDISSGAGNVATKLYVVGEASAGETIAWLRSIGAKEAIDSVALGAANAAAAFPSIQEIGSGAGYVAMKLYAVGEASATAVTTGSAIVVPIIQGIGSGAGHFATKLYAVGEASATAVTTGSAIVVPIIQGIGSGAGTFAASLYEAGKTSAIDIVNQASINGTIDALRSIGAHGAFYGAAVGAVGAASVVPIVQAIGFGGGGIAVNSYAAGMMSASAISCGGGVPAGGTVATLQSIGAVGSIGATTVIVAVLGCAAIGYGVPKLYYLATNTEKQIKSKL